MALNLPSLKPRPSEVSNFEFAEDCSGLGNVTVDQSSTARAQIAERHPIEHVVKNKWDHDLALQRSVLFHAQGPAGPMIQAMELRAANSVGRLPFLEGSNFQRDVLTGKDGEIDFEDVFGLVPRWSEQIVNPHTVMETMKPKLSF